jgi:hypothetical protein
LSWMYYPCVVGFSETQAQMASLRGHSLGGKATAPGHLLHHVRRSCAKIPSQSKL